MPVAVAVGLRTVATPRAFGYRTFTRSGCSFTVRYVYGCAVGYGSAHTATAFRLRLPDVLYVGYTFYVTVTRLVPLRLPALPRYRSAVAVFFGCGCVGLPHCSYGCRVTTLPFPFTHFVRLPVYARSPRFVTTCLRYGYAVHTAPLPAVWLHFVTLRGYATPFFTLVTFTVGLPTVAGYWFCLLGYRLPVTVRFWFFTTPTYRTRLRGCGSRFTLRLVGCHGSCGCGSQFTFAPHGYAVHRTLRSTVLVRLRLLYTFQLRGSCRTFGYGSRTVAFTPFVAADYVHYAPPCTPFAVGLRLVCRTVVHTAVCRLRSCTFYPCRYRFTAHAPFAGSFYPAVPRVYCLPAVRCYADYVRTAAIYVTVHILPLFAFGSPTLVTVCGSTPAGYYVPDYPATLRTYVRWLVTYTGSVGCGYAVLGYCTVDTRFTYCGYTFCTVVAALLRLRALCVCYGLPTHHTVTLLHRFVTVPHLPHARYRYTVYIWLQFCRFLRSHHVAFVIHTVAVAFSSPHVLPPACGCVAFCLQRGSIHTRFAFTVYHTRFTTAHWPLPTHILHRTLRLVAVARLRFWTHAVRLPFARTPRWITMHTCVPRTLPPVAYAPLPATVPVCSPHYTHRLHRTGFGSCILYCGSAVYVYTVAHAVACLHAFTHFIPFAVLAGLHVTYCPHHTALRLLRIAVCSGCYARLRCVAYGCPHAFATTAHVYARCYVYAVGYRGYAVTAHGCYPPTVLVRLLHVALRVSCRLRLVLVRFCGYTWLPCRMDSRLPTVPVIPFTGSSYRAWLHTVARSRLPFYAFWFRTFAVTPALLPGYACLPALGCGYRLPFFARGLRFNTAVHALRFVYGLPVGCAYRTIHTHARFLLPLYTPAVPGYVPPLFALRLPLPLCTPHYG